MKVEISCGAVVFTKDGEDIKYVVIKALNGDYGFPKGHMERGETEKETALREIREEVGLDVRILPDFRAVDEYPLPGKQGILKRVVFFAAYYENQDIVCQEDELESARVLPFDEARKILTFDSSRTVLDAADRFIRRTNK